jgi:uncharacterized protein (TIGR00251 family)
MSCSTGVACRYYEGMPGAFDQVTITERRGADTAARFAIRVQPRSSRSGVDDVHGDAVRVRVNAAPVDGAANEAVVEVIAKALGVPKRSVTIVSGATSRSKVVEVAGLTAASLRARLNEATAA